MTWVVHCPSVVLVVRLGLRSGAAFVGFDFGIGQILSLEFRIIAPIRGKCE